MKTWIITTIITLAIILLPITVYTKIELIIAKAIKYLASLLFLISIINIIILL